MSESIVHWTENEELLERFVLGRLGPTERTELELHLQTCGQCQAAIAKEQQLVAGIRLAGRDSVKRRLAQKVHQRKARHTNWYQVAGVAAGIVLLITVGIYNRWFTGVETQREKQDRADKMENRAESAPTAPPQGNLSNAEKPPAELARRTGGGAESKVHALPEGGSKAKEAESGRFANAQADRLRDSKATDAILEVAGQEKKDREVPSMVSTTIASTWIDGTVISERDQNAPSLMGAAENAKDERAVLRKGREESQQAAKASRIEIAEKNVQKFIVSQRPLSDLPPSQQNQRKNTSSIQTLLQKNPAGTVITVYLDTLLAKKELDQTRVQTIGEDSIIMNLGNRQVGYKLPPDWREQGALQNRKVK